VRCGRGALSDCGCGDAIVWDRLGEACEARRMGWRRSDREESEESVESRLLLVC
jgi:hypothetical protein